MPYGPRIVGFGQMAPGGRLPIHSDLANYVLTVHLPLALPSATAPSVG